MISYFSRIAIIAIFYVIAFTVSANKSVTLYVGQSTFVSCPDAPTGSIYQTAWGSRHGSVSVTKDGTYGAKIMVNSYFNGTAQVQCDYYWRWYVGNRQYTQHATTYYNVTCKKVDIRIDQSGPITLNSGDGIDLSASLSPSITPAPKVIWSSSNANIAEVNQNGYVWAKQPGSAEVSVSSNAGPDKASITINVNHVNAESAKLSPSSVNIVTDETKQLTLTTYPQYSKAETTSWYSRNPSIASINSNGSIQGNTPGSTYVYCVVNGYINTNEVLVNVSKPKLILSADKPSGLYEKGTLISLSSNKQGSTIYYTLDGSYPNKKSKKYYEPIRLDHNAVLKAFATKENCIDSDILSVDYTISSLNVSGTYPEKDTKVERVNVVPTVMFTDSIELANEGISLRSSNNTEVKGQVIVKGNSLSFVPGINLTEGKYTLTIPQRTIISSSKEYNFAYNLSFEIKGSDIIVDFCAGDMCSLVLKADGSLWGWGHDYLGQLGIGKDQTYQKPIKIFDNICSFETWDNTVAAINNIGELYMWGWAKYDGGYNFIYDKLYSSSPIKILDEVSKFAMSQTHTLVLSKTGRLFSWGKNQYGELGIGTQEAQLSPHYVMKNVRDISAHASLTHIITNNDELYTCGSGKNGELGNCHITECIATPQKIMDNVKKTVALGGASIVLKNDGTVWAFGTNESHQLGVDQNIKYSLEPIKILSDVRDIDGCINVVAAIKEDNSLWMWGFNGGCQIGIESGQYQNTPVKVLENTLKISVGMFHVLALTIDGEMYGWGLNSSSQITAWDHKNYYHKTPVKISHFPASKTPAIPEKIRLNDINIPLNGQGVLLPSISPANAGYAKIEWDSSNPEIAYVSDFGVVTGISEGKSSIRCRIYIDSELYIESECIATVTEQSASSSSEIIEESIEQSEPIYYNLQGIRVSKPKKGIYIMLQNGVSIKVFIP